MQLYPISALADHTFFIPNYQRGYRWGKQEVIKLLDDIWKFGQSGQNENNFYCLQPLVLLPNNAENGLYEVLDGQQRLTTITLIIHYFNEFFRGRNKYSTITLTYQTRPEITTALTSISLDERDKVIIPTELERSIDFWHIARAYEAIHYWFTEKNKGVDDDDFQRIFLNQVKVIWYEVDAQEDPIKVFERNNIGKIPLADVELIKAMLLNRANFEQNPLREQIELSRTWDHIEQTLRKSDFWSFAFGQEQQPEVRIQKLFSIVINLFKSDQSLANELNGKRLFDCIEYLIEHKYTSLNYFGKRELDINYFWERVLNIFTTIQTWYENHTLYHYIGFLTSQGVSTEKLYSISTNLGFHSSIDQLVSELKAEIKKLPVFSYLAYSSDSGFFLKNTQKEDRKNLYNKINVRALLLLHNIQLCLRPNSYERFPFDEFNATGKRQSGWDIEHIDSQTEKTIKGLNAQLEWFERIPHSIKQEWDETLRLKVESYINRSESDDELFQAIREEISSVEGEIGDEFSQSLGNLVLLDASTNRSYGNDLFIQKRNTIRERDAQGRFIPQGTRIAFMKYFPNAEARLDKWSKQDKHAHEDYIYQSIKEFVHSNN